ncbi:hypothetical protein OG884_20420 [Streptosporangium sp. NBC_01755]|uniref:phosphorylase family protein n=1 Tax=unclassified Streptosporangium TaxID=2632669 RepID=UPI002DDA5179|nr:MULTISPECIES: hypothetical protein [unclassified Streptosporangium]WSA24657.1 hypothetical protein OIE13_27495 [Streptosporangium sp. NBC_01810]WSC97267.1 hypothetical protein OG884_20420 [Streptosporangium sp. NBC_01755]
MTGLLICTALAVEARAVRSGLSVEDVKVIRTGMGPRRAAGAAARLPSAGALAVTGFCGALDEGLRPGDVLVASEVRFGGRTVPCPSAWPLAEELARAGLSARTGPLVTSDHIVTGAERRGLAAEGASAVDMETGPLAGAVPGLPFAALRVVADVAGAALSRPATIRGGIVAYRTLCRLGPFLARWAAAISAALPEESVPFHHPRRCNPDADTDPPESSHRRLHPPPEASRAGEVPASGGA